jgi:ribosomal protein S18 acetylase RimI-like enzyme
MPPSRRPAPPATITAANRTHAIIGVVVTLRVLAPGDWPVWRAVRFAALTDAPHAFVSTLADWHRGGEDLWRARLALPDTHNVVAMLDEHPVGVARGVPGEHGPELHSVWVSPKARGLGVGDRLLAEVEDWAVRSGAPALRLTVFPGNAPAVALYERHGYVRTDELADHAGQVTMVKSLG